MPEKLMHGVKDRGLGRTTHALCTPDGMPLVMTAENVERIVNLWNSADISKEELVERILLLTDSALSALCLKLNVEHFPEKVPPLDALNRDLDAFTRRFGGMGLSPEIRATLRPDNYAELSPEEQWKIDKKLGLLDWEGKP
jgi:hypothetical protein